MKDVWLVMKEGMWLVMKEGMWLVMKEGMCGEGGLDHEEGKQPGVGVCVCPGMDQEQGKSPGVGKGMQPDGGATWDGSNVCRQMTFHCIGCQRNCLATRVVIGM